MDDFIHELIAHDLDDEFINRKCNHVVDYTIKYDGKYDIIRRGWSYLSKVKHSTLVDDIYLARGKKVILIKGKRMLIKAFYTFINCT